MDLSENLTIQYLVSAREELPSHFPRLKELRYEEIEPVHWNELSKVLSSTKRQGCLMKEW